MDSKRSFTIRGYAVHLYPGQGENLPLIIYNSFKGDGSDIRTLAEEECPPHHLLTIEIDNWGDDMSPWFCAPLTPKDMPSGGKADEYLRVLEEDIIPVVTGSLSSSPAYMGITGYSLAGVFALYSLYNTDIFSCCGSISGALWYPDLLDYLQSHSMKRTPRYIYMSLGDKESKTRHPLLKTVSDKTQSIYRHFFESGINTFFEYNPGGHFKDASSRVEKCIFRMLSGV